MNAVVAFDLDDTLFSEWEYVDSGYHAVARALAETTGADAKELFGIIRRGRPLGFEAALEHLKGATGIEQFTIDSMVETYRAHFPDIHLRDGAETCLAELQARGAKLVLITDGSTRHQRTKFKALGLERFFGDDAILVSEETGGDKTTEVPWRLVEERFGTPGTRFFYVGDNMSKDFLLPARHGWTTVMLLDKRGTNVFPQEPTAWGAGHAAMLTIDSLPAILKHPALQK